MRGGDGWGVGGGVFFQAHVVVVRVDFLAAVELKHLASSRLTGKSESLTLGLLLTYLIGSKNSPD